MIVLPDDAANRALVAHTHPPDWVNPTPEGRYNLVVLGGGTAGLVAAAGAATLGGKAALVERHLLGGDCLAYGCVPSKALLRAARAAAEVRDAGRFGISGGGTVDFGAVMARMRELRAEIAPHDGAARLRDLGVDVYLGEGRFTGPDTLEVGGQTLRFARAVVATGARAAVPPVPGLAEAGYLTNETVFSLTELPRRLVVVGAGPIGCELAQAFRRFGAEVTIVALDPRVLPREDPDASEVLARRLAAEGVELVLGAKLARVEVRPEGKSVVFAREGRGEEERVCDVLLLAAGRVPNVEDIGLDAAGVRTGPTGVVVDAHLRTTNPRVYASGDVCSRYQFTHAADALSRLVLRNALFFGRGKVDDLVVPWVTYTDPEVARVGMTEAEARAAGHDVRTFTVPMADNDRAVLDGDTDGFARVHTTPSGRILGATLVSAHAGETIGEIVLAMRKGLSVAELSATIHPYPTQADALRRLGDAYLRTHLTPGRAKWLARLLAWRR